MTHHTKEAQAAILVRRIAAAALETRDLPIPKTLIPGAYTPPPDHRRSINRMGQLGNLGLSKLQELSLDCGELGSIAYIDILREAEKAFSFKVGVRPN